MAVDLFNVFITFNPATVVGNQSSIYLGRPVSALPLRRSQLSARFTF